MQGMNRRVAILAAALVMVCSPTWAGTPDSEDDGTAPKAGQLVMSLSARDMAQQYWLALKFCRIGEKMQGRLEFNFHGGLLLPPKGDFASASDSKSGLMSLFQRLDEISYGDKGVVLVKDLPPGKYEIFDVDNFYNTGYVQKNFWLKSPVSIPFEIKPGAATYIGEFKAFPVFGNNVFGLPIPAGVRFVVSDQSARDLPIARQKNPNVGEVQIAIPDVDSLNNPVFSSKP